MKKNDLFSKRNLGFIAFLTANILTRIYKEEFDYYFDKIPTPIITGVLILVLLFFIYKALTPTKRENETVFIPSENDYTHKDTSVGFTVILIVSFLTYAYFVNEYSINPILILLIVLVALISGSFLSKTASFQVKNKNITYKNGKEERVFNTDEIISLEVYPNQIHIHKQDSKETLLFLSLDKTDFQNIKSYFNKRVPEISVKLAQNSSN
ncbi:hypothetical protein [Tenacibaculum sp. 190524A05c]|uniref:PH (Pleckstrin Homology) domain-containing protein n=1 Tax=Tenacibaculum platacis TaxID=3137852 RepID=A0ABP1ESD2_9FLAO